MSEPNSFFEVYEPLEDEVIQESNLQVSRKLSYPSLLLCPHFTHLTPLPKASTLAWAQQGRLVMPMAEGIAVWERPAEAPRPGGTSPWRHVHSYPPHSAVIQMEAIAELDILFVLAKDGLHAYSLSSPGPCLLQVAGSKFRSATSMSILTNLDPPSRLPSSNAQQRGQSSSIMSPSLASPSLTSPSPATPGPTTPSLPSSASRNFVHLALHSKRHTKCIRVRLTRHPEHYTLTACTLNQQSDFYLRDTPRHVVPLRPDGKLLLVVYGASYAVIEVDDKPFSPASMGLTLTVKEGLVVDSKSAQAAAVWLEASREVALAVGNQVVVMERPKNLDEALRPVATVSLPHAITSLRAMGPFLLASTEGILDVLLADRDAGFQVMQRLYFPGVETFAVHDEWLAIACKLPRVNRMTIDVLRWDAARLVDQLESRKMHAMALALLARLPESEIREQKVAEVNMAYGLELLEAGEFKDALYHLSQREDASVLLRILGLAGGSEEAHEAVKQLDKEQRDSLFAEALPYVLTFRARAACSRLASELSKEERSNEAYGVHRLLDTALVHIFHALGDKGPLLQFCSEPNLAEPEQCRGILQDDPTLKPALASLYKMAGQHDEALLLLRQSSDAEALFHYLINLRPGERSIELVLRHLEAVMNEPRQLELLRALARQHGVEAVLERIESVAPRLQALFLEHTISTNQSSGPHVKARIERLVEIYADMGPSESLGKLRRLILQEPLVTGSLIQLLEKKDGLKSEYILLLAKAGREEEAVKELLRLPLTQAEELLSQCERHFHKPGLWRSYTDALLAKQKAAKDQAAVDPEQVIELMNRHAAQLDPLRILEALPDSIPISKALPFLSNSILALQEQRRSVATEKALLRIQDLKLQAELASKKSRAFLITRDELCTICQKRLGTTAFCAHPNGDLTHMHCTTL